jgi:hypothetical protein
MRIVLSNNLYLWKLRKEEILKKKKRNEKFRKFKKTRDMGDK